MAVPLGERRLPVYNLVKKISALALLPFFRLQVIGHDNIPEKGPFLLLPKHQCWEDIPLLAMAIERPLYFIAKYELFRNPLSRLLLSSLGGLPLNRLRTSESIQTVKKVFELLKKGEAVVVFPEGTYHKQRMGKGHKGLIRMILSRSVAPLVPLGVNYSKEGHRIHARIEIGRPVLLESSCGINKGLDLAFMEIARLSRLQAYDNGEDKDD
jgi:1-acyl-sn-glycerol-3-phosphate acyltransferase